MSSATSAKSTASSRPFRSPQCSIGLSSPLQWMNRVQAARSLGDADRCLEIVVEGLGQFGDRGDVQLFAGEVYAAQGLYCEALQCYDAAARWSDGGRPGVEQSHGQREGRQPPLPATSPVTIEALLCGAALLAELGFAAEARVRFEAVLVLDEDREGGPLDRSVSARTALALDLVRWAEEARLTAEPEVVRETLERSLRVCETPSARLALARLCLGTGAPELALEHLEAGRQLDPENPEFPNVAARCYVALGRTNEAREALLRSQMLGDQSLSGALLRHQTGASGGFSGLDGEDDDLSVGFQP